MSPSCRFACRCRESTSSRSSPTRGALSPGTIKPDGSTRATKSYSTRPESEANQGVRALLRARIERDGRAGDASGFTLAQQIYVTRGEIAARADEAAAGGLQPSPGEPLLARARGDATATRSTSSRWAPRAIRSVAPRRPGARRFEPEGEPSQRGDRTARRRRSRARLRERHGVRPRRPNTLYLALRHRG